MRVGFGYDLHRLESGSSITLGGVKVPFNKKFKAHSDGDVLLHAICDAILGAAALGDIGKHFPDTDERFAGISSLELLKDTVFMLENEGFTLQNIDATIVMEKPYLQPYIAGMRKNIAESCHLSIGAVSVKATTSEKIGHVGSGEAAEVYSVALII
ncbi:MAG: 2-C-methyl-D-erythritol 2,4-cyclodiphosphate synthase [Bacteroidota bacterium]|nr:2-C-methyl-D-erythritol 2,4-cyclodiphosphate synthase [Bacteroidota bacterium]